VGEAAVIGRERERAVLRKFLDGTPRPAALLLRGEAGIGKTTLWRDALASARSSGAVVLSCRPAESEAQLSFSGLADLLAPVLPDALVGLPGPQRKPLEVALLLTDAGQAPPDLRLIATAFLSVVRVLAADSPVLLAIDDVQWLDHPTARVIEFAVRRLQSERVALLVSERAQGGSTDPLGLAATEHPLALTRLVLEPMSIGEVHQLVHGQLGIVLSRPVLRQLHESSAGNPFYALEIGRALQRREHGPSAAQPLPIPSSLQRLVHERLEALPGHVRHLLALLSALLDRRLSTVRAIATHAGLAGAVDEAVRAGVIEVAGGRISFTHPLIAAAVYAELGPEQRHAAHELLAQLTSDEERALHLALAIDAQDSEAARELALAADRAEARGATVTAARLSEQAARLTPDADAQARDRCSVTAALRYAAAGDPIHARILLEQAIPRIASNRLRAQALMQLAWINLEEVDLAVAVDLLEQALREAGGDDDLQGEISVRLGIVEGIRGDGEAVERHQRAAVEAAERCGSQPLLARALAQVAYTRLLAGEGVAPEAWRAVEIEAEIPDFLGAYSAKLALGQLLMYVDRFEEARAVLGEVLTRSVAAGDEEARAQVLFHLGDLERRAGNLTAAEPLANEASELWLQGGNEQEYASSLCVLATLDALAGRLEQARAKATSGLEAAERIGDETFAIHHRGALGLIELTAGDPIAAQRWLEPATDALIRRAVAEVSIYPAVQNEIDALLAAGNLDRSERLVRWLEELGARTGRSWTLAIAARGRGLLKAAGGDFDAARKSLAESLAAHGASGQPFERARTLLAIGSVERRAKQKRAARESLEQAAAMFAELPSPPWEAMARRELSRLGLRAAPGELTETEARIAELAATGMSNPEIAAAAFVSRKTVEANLTKIYRKLGVRSRVELARRLPVR
jgi:DNA-binding CsgD family transcriptional regulator